MTTTPAPLASTGWRTFFLVAAIYDLVLGAVFFAFAGPIFDAFRLELPNSMSYVHLTAAFVFVQGVGYWIVYRNPVANVGIVAMGVAYKGAYVLLAVFYLVTGELIHAVFGWFGVFDALFLAGFVWFLLGLRGRAGIPGPEAAPLRR